MPRRDRGQAQEYSSAESKVIRLLDSPLREVGKKLQEVLSQAKLGSQNRFADNGLVEVAEYVAHIADRLPQSFGQRFHFDSALISGIARDWGEQVTASGMIMPRHGGGWGHERVMMPSEDANSLHVVDLILLPREDRLEDIDLLSYPWIIHEMDHYLFLRYDSLFIPAFQAELEKVATSLRLGAISDRGSARTRAHKNVEELLQFWPPTPDQKNWAHELAIDIVSVWTCGPAYLDCFQDVVDNPDLNPYKITSTHPPYSIRAEALIKASGELGLEKYSTNLRSLAEGWRNSRWKRRRDNRYFALTRSDLVESCMKSAFGFCKSLGLRPCTEKYVENLKESLSTFDTDEIGINLLLYAWLKFDKSGEEVYSAWESQVVAELTAKVM